MTRPRGIAALFAALLAIACVTEEIQKPGTTWEIETPDTPLVAVGPPPDDRPPIDDDLLRLLKPASAADLGPDFLADQPPSPFHRLGRDVIRGIDGSWTKMYTLRAGRGESIISLIRAYLPDFPAEPNTPSDPEGLPNEIIRWTIHKDFHKDEMPIAFGSRENLPNPNVADVLHVTAPPETLLFIDALLHKVMGDLPQIELEVRIVEVNLDDVLEWDSKFTARKLDDPDLPFDASTNPVDGNFGAGYPILDPPLNPDPSGIGAGFSSFASAPTLTGFLLSLQGVHNNLRVDSVISFLQTIGSLEIISSPTITVLNGHRARLTTGDLVPVFEASGNVNSPNISTEFQPTGVTIELVPFIVSDDLVRIDVSIDFSAQTGEVPYVISGVEVASPIISQRAAGTTVHVYDGQVFSVGGLRSTTQIESITKVPLLGDIPLLGWFFKSRSSEKTNTEILFFITPKVHIPSESLINPIGS